MSPNEVNTMLKGVFGPILTKETKSAINVALWDVSKRIANQANRERLDAVKDAEAAKDLVAEAKQKNIIRKKKETLTDEERLEELTAFLDAKLISGELDASMLNQFKDIYGLKSRDRDIQIQVIDFKDALPDEYEAMNVARKMIDAEIERVNSINNA